MSRRANTRHAPDGHDPMGQPSAVAVVRLESGGYLMALNSHSTRNPAEIWFFLTDNQSLREEGAKWYFHNYLGLPIASGVENMNFVTQCDGRVFLLLGGNPDTATPPEGGSGSGVENGVTNIINAWELVKDGDKLSLDYRAARGAFRNNGHADFRAAANFYVSPQGDMILYSNGRGVFTDLPLFDSLNHQMAEFVTPNFCGLGGC